MKLWYVLKLLFHVIRGVMAPTELKHSLRAGEVLCASGVLATTVEKIRAAPGGEVFFREKNFDFHHGLAFFERFPEGSLAKSYFHHLKKSGLDPDSFPQVNVKDDASYVEHVIRHTHDLWHVLTGFDVSIAGELGLQAFMAKQINWPFAMVGIGGGAFVTLFKTPSQIEGLMDQIVRGGQLGAACKPLITVNWNKMWHVPLVQIRRDFGLDLFDRFAHEQHNITYQKIGAFAVPPLQTSDHLSFDDSEPATVEI